jgi:copper transport protein
MWGLALLLMVLLLMSDALVSHAAATIAWKSLAIGAELVHLLGVILWVGGLGYFATLFWWSTFREASLGSELAWAIPAFSLLAVGSVGLLTISGLYLAQLYLDSLDQLLATSYGRVLLIKLAVVALMMVLGGYHQFIVHPRIVASLDQAGYSPDRSSQQFRKTLRIEALLGLSALPLAALLGTTSPPSHPPPHIDKTLQQVRVVDDAQLSVEVWPLRPGSNAIRVTVTGRDGQTLADATAVVLQLQAAASEAAPLGFTLDRESPGVFVKKDMVLGIEGKWKGQVTVQRHGAYDLRDHFELTLMSPVDHRATPSSATAVSLVMMVVSLGIAGITVFLLLISKRRLSTALRRIDVRDQQLISHPDRRANDAD